MGACGGGVALARHSIVAWVAAHVLPREPAVRRWLRRKGLADTDVEDLVQEAYCRIAALSSVDHIAQPGAYLFQVVRNLHLEQLRRNKVVAMTVLTDQEASSIIDDAADPERAAIAKLDLLRVEALIAGLPDRCRQIFTWKRVEGLSQREIAARLGVSEHVVENDVMKGLRLILASLEGMQTQGDGREGGTHAGRRQRA